MNSFYVGVDVGTGSVRAALVDKNGKIKVTAEESISINNPNPDFYEQSSNEIWLKCCALVKVYSCYSIVDYNCFVSSLKKTFFQFWCWCLPTLLHYCTFLSKVLKDFLSYEKCLFNN